MKFSRLLLIGLLGLGGAAQAATFGFNCITDNSGDCGGIAAPLLTLDITASGSGDTQFLFSVADQETDATVTSIFFDDDLGLVSPVSTYAATIDDSLEGVDFLDSLVEGGNLPGGNSLTSKFNSDLKAARVKKGGVHNGIDEGEWLGITFENTDTNLIISALNAGDLRIGVHLQSILDDDFSESLVVAAVPLPASVWLFGSALLGFIGISRRRKI